MEVDKVEPGPNKEPEQELPDFWSTSFRCVPVPPKYKQLRDVGRGDLDGFDFPVLRLSPVLARGIADGYYWIKKETTTDFHNWSYWNRNKMTLYEVVEVWKRLPAITLPQDLRHNEARRQEKRALWLAHEKLVNDFFGKREWTKARPDREERQARVQAVKDFLRTVHVPVAIPERILGMPDLESDPWDWLIERTKFDERISIPVEYLMESDELKDYFDKETVGGQKYVVAKRFYRCPNFFWLQTKIRSAHLGKNRPTDAVWVGPFECGNMLSAFGDWQHLVRTGKSKAANIWNCFGCYGDWMGSNKQGQWGVMIYTMTRVLTLVLDHPPAQLLARWEKNRALLYKKVEPKAPLRDVRPVYPKNSKLSTVQFTGDASDAVWKTLLADLDETSWKQLEGGTAGLLEGDLSMLTQLNTGTEYHTVGHTPQGRKAVEQCMEITASGPRLKKEAVTQEGPKKHWLKDYAVKPGEAITKAPPTTELVQSVAAEKEAASSSAAPAPPTVEAPMPPAPEEPPEEPPVYKTKQAQEIAGRMAELKQALLARKESGSSK